MVEGEACGSLRGAGNCDLLLPEKCISAPNSICFRCFICLKSKVTWVGPRVRARIEARFPYSPSSILSLMPKCLFQHERQWSNS